ncbi:hypothetical protein Taro_012339 [Colocasia esculenta]|uniref:Serine aminopeptidase S33 domain-containing protein n=1 Tax=Colocasia esculenta TaxID=4460 RepID=A0A843UIU8_COLES|nr:hypothetical protein [Colocasia esculenta]
MARHPVAEANEKSPFGDLTPEEFYSRHGVAHATSTYRNPRGLNIFNQSWVPLAGDPAGILCVVHGFTGESNWFLQLTPVFFVEHGRFGVCALDHQGHGFSDGLQAHIPDINPVVDDCLAVFDAFRARFPPPSPASSTPSPSAAPSPSSSISAARIRSRQRAVAGTAPSSTAPCAPSARSSNRRGRWSASSGWPRTCCPPGRSSPPGAPSLMYRSRWKRKLAVASPRRPLGRPRAATALELLRVCRELQGRFDCAAADRPRVGGPGV